MLLKLRAVAGDPVLGAELEVARDELLFGERPEGCSSGEALRTDVSAMRYRIEQALADENLDFYNLKLGRGGLLDVEFIAQYLQLAHGKDEASVRGRATVEVLEAAQAASLIDGDRCAALLDGYMFLRKLESRLRIVRDRSAARLPRAPGALEVVARRLGYRARPEGDASSAGAQLLSHYRERTSEIRAVFEELLA